MLGKQTRIGLLAPITWSIPPKGYGPWEKVVTNIAQGLVKRGYSNITIIATEEAHIAGAKTEAVINQPLGEPGPSNAQELNQQHIEHAYEFARKNLDIIHNHFNFHPLNLLSRLTIPVVTTLHGSGSEPGARIEYEKHKNLAFVSISNAERQFIPSLNYVATVYNGINTEEFRFNRKPQPYLVNAGRIHPTKGVHHAIELAQKLNFPLKIAGLIQEDQKGYFKEKIEPYVDGKIIEYLGQLSVDDTAELVRHATAAVGLIEWEEPFGLSVAEAMICGTPVIATPRGAHSEIVQNGVTGILVNNANEAVTRFREVLQIDRARCSTEAEKMFSLDTMTDGYLTVYERLLGQKD